MKKKEQPIDKILLTLTILLSVVGLFVFTSASFGLVARKGFSLQDLLLDQVLFGLVFGVVVAGVVAYKVPIKLLNKYSLYIFIGSIILTLLVFIPGIGASHGGAHRWIWLAGVSFQPSEILKLGSVIYLASLLGLFKDRLGDIKYSLGLTAGVFLIPAVLLLAEPDTGTLAVLFAAFCAMFIASGAKLRYFFAVVLISVLAVGVLAMVRPYVKERILTFLDPSHDPQGSSYQLQKSLLAIGSGGVSGRGFGQSIQKFSSLPEPTGDSVFAVAGEEFGFIGGVVIIVLFFLFGLRGIYIAKKSPNLFVGLLAVGIAILIVSQSFANIAAMLGLIPLTGVPLVFISHGGTALLVAFLEVGILLNISRLKRI